MLGAGGGDVGGGGDLRLGLLRGGGGGEAGGGGEGDVFLSG